MIKEEVIINIKDLERQQNECKAILKIRQEKFDEDNEVIKSKIFSFDDLININKQTLRDQGLEEFLKTDNKQLSFGLSVRIKKNLIIDEVKALEWANDHSLCLQLDKAAFKRIAEIPELKIDSDIVTKEEKILICLPKEFNLK